MHSKVSVIIPTYNSEKYVAKAIESALQQTYPNVEVIVVDDASQDGTVEVVAGYCSDRLKLIVSDRNRGPSYTRNRGIEAAQGEWIALLDSDDWYAPNRLEKLLQVALTKNADFVVDDLYFISDGAAKPWSTRFAQKAGFSSRQMRFEQITQINAVDFIDLDLGLVKPLIKHNFLIQHNFKFDEELRYGEDFQLFVLSLINGARFIVVPEPYYFYCSRPNSLVTDYIKCQEQLYLSTVKTLEIPLINQHTNVKYSLYNRLLKLDKSIKTSRSYNQVMRPLKQGNLSIALAQMIHNPLFFRFVLLEILRRIKLQWNHLSSRLSLVEN